MRAFLPLSLIFILDLVFGSTCPCDNSSLCQVLKVPMDRRELFAFKFRSNDVWKTYDWSRITTVAEFSAQVEPQLICVAHSKNIRVVTVTTAYPVDQLSNRTSRSLWIGEQVKKVRNGFYDGINVDIESALEVKDGPLLTSLVAELRNKLKAINSNYQVTFDVGWSPSLTFVLDQ
eukprot:TRINITY_DN3663_c0_g1_i2.p1 TRINITY_DN3663_c0_g1~~TRINITY_DN3663_c0_g1_i2.p1  ORF type:complete len:175 (-),score=31.49 TRINITY_DN3663_c0_g1_i2:79-603(-)